MKTNVKRAKKAHKKPYRIPNIYVQVVWTQGLRSCRFKLQSSSNLLPPLLHLRVVGTVSSPLDQTENSSPTCHRLTHTQDPTAAKNCHPVQKCVETLPALGMKENSVAAGFSQGKLPTFPHTNRLLIGSIPLNWVNGVNNMLTLRTDSARRSAKSEMLFSDRFRCCRLTHDDTPAML